MKKQGFSGLPSYVSLAFLRGRHIYFVKVPSWANPFYMGVLQIHFVWVPCKSILYGCLASLFCVDVLQIRFVWMSCKPNQPFNSRRTSFGFSLRPPGPQSQSLCFFQKVNIRRNIKLIISRGHQLENFDWNVCPELAGVTHGITLPGNRTFLFTSDQYWRLLPGSFLKFNLLPFHNPLQEYCSGWVRKPRLPS